MPRIAFVNENTLGHRSYLAPFAEMLHFPASSRFEIDWFDAAPIPPDLAWFGNSSIRGLRRWGLDGGATRWRIAASRHALRQVMAGHRQKPYDAVVVNTQSVALALAKWRGCPPLFVCMDATFRQLARTPWLAPGTIGPWVAPIMLDWLFRREQQVFQRAAMLMPWSELARRSLQEEYRINPEKVRVLPPSCQQREPIPHTRQTGRRSQVLFMGSDFRRKGGPVLLEAWRRYLRATTDLHLVTSSDVPVEPGLVVHRGISHGSESWVHRWREADLFVFPSMLETFGIVLVEALSFGVPVISSRAGAAEEILDNGRAGMLLDVVSPEAIAGAVRQVLGNTADTRGRVDNGLVRVRERYNLAKNADRLAEMLEEYPPPKGCKRSTVGLPAG